MVVLYGLLAVLAGAMVTVSSTLNAQVGRKHGIYTATLFNNMLGTIVSGTIIILLFGGIEFDTVGIQRIPTWALLGGLVAIIIVVGSNIIVPQIPITYTSLLIFIGQFTIGLLMDYLGGNEISMGKLIGFLLVLMGLLYNFYVDTLKEI